MLIGPVIEMSPNQHSVMRSFLEVVLYLGVATVQEAIWLKRFLQRLGITTHSEEAITIYSDSTAALAYPKGPKCH